MRHLSHILCIATALFVAVCFQQKALAQTNLTTELYQGSGHNWLEATCWETNAPGTGTPPPAPTGNGNAYPSPPAVAPVAGNTYEEVENSDPLTYSTGTNGNNTRVRNPTASGSSQQFPGDSLTLDNNTEIRF